MNDVRSIVEQQARAGTRWRVVEALPWLLFVGFYFVFETRLALGNSVLVMVLFTLSLDLVLGYAGIATLGHALSSGWAPIPLESSSSQAGLSPSVDYCLRHWWRRQQR